MATTTKPIATSGIAIRDRRSMPRRTPKAATRPIAPKTSTVRLTLSSVIPPKFRA